MCGSFRRKTFQFTDSTREFEPEVNAVKQTSPEHHWPTKTIAGTILKVKSEYYKTDTTWQIYFAQ